MLHFGVETARIKTHMSLVTVNGEIITETKIQSITLRLYWAVRHESGSNEFLCVHLLKAHNLIEILWILHIRKDVWHETHAKICSS